MLEISEATGAVIAGELTQTFQDIDRALLSTARLSVSLLEAAQSLAIEPRRKQSLLEHLFCGCGLAVESRGRFMGVWRDSRAIQGQSNLKEMNWGCGQTPPPAEFFTSAALEGEERVGGAA